MKRYSITEIERRITEDFTSIYKNASNFPGTLLYSECMKIIKNPSDLRCIIFANDLGIPPVKSLLFILGKRKIITENVTGIESQSMGSLMGFLFKKVFQYQKQKDRLSVKMFGVKTAALFYDIDDFEITEE